MSFLNKYKDRCPEETIKIIENFFLNKGYKIIVEELQPTECETWGCVLYLAIDNQKILTSNGKGMTKEFALASGYAEMFERFSNRIAIYLNAFWGKDSLMSNYKKHGYYINKEEKLVSFEEVMQIPYLSNWINSIFLNPNDQKRYLTTLCPISFIGIPYTSYFTNQIEYLDPRIITRMQTSSGMAAGNTLEEALVQGLNEIFEHYTSCFFLKEPQQEYYQIDHSYLPQSLQETIKLIEKDNNYSFELYDLSYNFGFPVCMSLLINKTQLSFHPNFGSAPTFELAAERTITETYQNRYTYLDTQRPQESILSEHWSKKYAYGFRTLTATQTFDENFFFVKKIKSKPNPAVYFQIEDNISNIDILKHYDELCKKHNTEFYYYNNSPIKEMAAVQIFCPNLDLKAHERILYSELTTIEEKNIYLTCLFNNCELLQQIRDQETFDQKQSEYLFNLMMFNMTHWDFSKFGGLTGFDWMRPMPTFGKPTGLVDIFHVLNRNISLANMYSNIKTPQYKSTAKFYCTLYNFLQVKHPPEKIKQIFSLWGKEVSYEDIACCQNKIYLFKKIILENFAAAIRSKEYKFFIESFND